jgi:[acyl-carrier-protein] S-malonyltransferase
MAYHTPLREAFREFITPYLATLDFADPQLPFYGGLDARRLTTADHIRDLFERNPTAQINLPHVLDAMHETGVELVVIPGSSIPPGVLKLPFPAIHVHKPEDVDKALSAIYELDVQYPETGVSI